MMHIYGLARSQEVLGGFFEAFPAASWPAGGLRLMGMMQQLGVVPGPDGG